jgi:hypothetical protein
VKALIPSINGHFFYELLVSLAFLAAVNKEVIFGMVKWASAREGFFYKNPQD